MKKILFVCLGNICRSPMAEGIMKDILQKRGWQEDFFIESAGTAAYHVGKSPDPRMRITANKHGISLVSKARQFAAKDFDTFDLIIAMDSSNKSDILKLSKNEVETKKVILMRNFDELSFLNLDVPDPYYGGDAGFENVYQILSRCCNNILKELANK